MKLLVFNYIVIIKYVVAEIKMKLKKGYTLIEILIYVVLAGGVLAAGVKFLWDFVKLQVKEEQYQAVSNSQAVVMGRFRSLVSQSRRIVGVSNSQLDLDIGGETKSLRINNGLVEELVNGNWLSLGDPNIEQVGEFVDQSDNQNQAKIVELHLSSSRDNSVNEWRMSIESKGQSNQGREVLADVSRAYLGGSNNNELREVYLENVGFETVRLEKLWLSWQSSSNRLTRVRVDGSQVWSGNVASGTEIDISGRNINTDSRIKLDFDFSQNLEGETLEIKFILTDSSWVIAELQPKASGGGGTMTCNSYCQLEGYRGGICRNHWRACLFNGETHESGGDQYCTGGPSADTCCCGNEEVKTCEEICQDAGYDTGTCKRNERACKRNDEVHNSNGDRYCTGGASADTCCCGYRDGGGRTCDDVCKNADYDGGVCRRNARDCRRNNEDHLSAGDQYCTGGPKEDTCCCRNDWWGGWSLW